MLITTLTDYLNNRRWLYHERGLDAEWEILHKIALAAPPATTTLGDGDLGSDYNVDLTTDGVHNSGEAAIPPALYRNP